MTITLAETYVVKAEARQEFASLVDQFLAFKKDHPDLFAGLLSWKLHRQAFGSPSGMYVELWEFDDLQQMEQVTARVFGHDDGKAILDAFHQLLVPATFTASIWRSVASS